MARSAARIAASVQGTGIYPVSAAARLLGESPPTVRRWAFGYRRRGQSHRPAITTDLAAVEGTHALTFLDLVELLFVQALLASGLSWPRVREASRVAARLLQDEPHPFATRRWFADAAAVYLRLGERHGEEILVEVAGHAQVAMDAVLSPYLTQLDFDGRGVAQRWFPGGLGTDVVLDPRRSFGMPVTTRGGVPTETLARLHAAGDAPSTIAAWYQIDEAEVLAALAYEATLATA